MICSAHGIVRGTLRPSRDVASIVCAWSSGPVDARVLILSAHPDDDVIGVGGSLHRITDPYVVYLTDGAPASLLSSFITRGAEQNAYKRQRQRYSIQALALAGIGPSRVFFLGAQDQKASERIASLSHSLSNILTRVQPDALVVQPYEGGHPDHDAARMIAEEAAKLAEQKTGRKIGLIEMTSYHRGFDGQIEVGCFLEGDGIPMRLTPQERAMRRAMLEVHTPKPGDAQRLDDIATVNQFKGDLDEQIRIARPADFDRPPHMGPLFYDRFLWSGGWARFHQGVDKARRMLSTKSTKVAGAWIACHPRWTR